MEWVVIVVRTLVGLMFLVFGVNGLLPEPFIPIPLPPAGDALSFLKSLSGSHYLTAVKLVEVVGGLLLLSGRAAPFGIVLLMPVAVNILLYEVFLLRAPGPGYGLVPMLAFLVWGYRRYFAPVFTLAATPGTSDSRHNDGGWDVGPGGAAKP